MKKSKKDLDDRIKRQELRKPGNEASMELFRRIDLYRQREGYKSEYDCLVALGVIDEVIVPKGTVNLFPYMKQKLMLVKNAMSDPEVRAKVEIMQDNFRKECEREGVLY